MRIPALEIDSDGNIMTLYTEEIHLFELGSISNVERASNIVFDETTQEWIVVKASDSKEVHRNSRRSAAIDWEIVAFSPGGKYYEEH